MSIDLKGNTNYVALRGLPTIDTTTGALTPGDYVVPRTALSAIDLVAGHGIIVNADTISVDDAVIHNIDIATTAEILTGATGSVIDPAGLKGALSAGQGVDVTAVPTVVDATSNVSSQNYRTDFTVDITGGVPISSVGFTADYPFPNYAEGKKYLLLLEVKLISGDSGLVRGFDNDVQQTNVVSNEQDLRFGADGQFHRFAFVATHSNAHFNLYGSFTLNRSYEVRNWRQYEVTALTAEGIEALAKAPIDDFDYIHLIDQDMVNPWIPIIDMGTSSNTVIHPGLSYKLNAQTGTHTLTVPSIPAKHSGVDAYVELYVGGEGSIMVQRPLVLGSTITPYSTNQCTVKFRDGEAILIVDDYSTAYVVTVKNGMVGDNLSGSLYYGLTTATATEIAFNSGLDGEVVSIPDSTTISTVSRDVTLLGNGVANTQIGGWTNSKIWAGATYNSSLSHRIIAKDLTITGIINTTEGPYFGDLDGCVVTGNTAGNTSQVGSSLLILTGCTISDTLITDNTALYQQSSDYKSSMIYATGYSLITGTTITNNNSVYSLRATNGVNHSVMDSILDAISVETGTVSVAGSTVGDVHYMLTSPKANFSGTNTVYGKITGAGTTSLTATSILDLSNNTHAAVASGGTVTAAAGAHIIAYGGNTVSISANTSGTYLLNNGTITSDIYVVTNTSSNAETSGSLPYGIATSVPPTFLFDTAIDGQTVPLGTGDFGSTSYQFLGNGIDKTIISGSTASGAGATLSALDMNFSIVGVRLVISNCYVHGQSVAVLNGNGQRCLISGSSCSFNNVHFDELNPGNALSALWVVDMNSGGPHYVTNCLYENCQNTESHLVCKDTTITGSTFKNNLVSSTQSGRSITTLYTNTNIVVDCLYTGTSASDISNHHYALAAFGTYSLVSGSTFATSFDRIAINGPLFLNGTNVINSTIEGPGQLKLVADSVMDLTGNSQSCVVFGANDTLASITGTPINVVASTASDAAIGGTATIRYMGYAGQDPVDPWVPLYEPMERTISGGGAGYIMRNNGAWGVPVTVASGTASGSLYDLIMTTKPRDITFAPAMDGQTVSVAWLNMYSMASHWCYLMGAGVDKTTLNVTGLIMTGSYHARMSDMTVIGMSRLVYMKDASNLAITGCYPYIASGSYGTDQMFYIANNDSMSDVMFSGCTANTTAGVLQMSHNSSATNVTITGCSGTYMDVYMNADTGNTPVITGGTFTNNRCTDTSMGIVRTGGTGGAAYRLVNCIFNNPTNTSYAINTYGALTISGGTFSSSGDGIYVQAGTTVTFSSTNILNSTISGAGSVVFADGATITSTDGNGTIATTSDRTSMIGGDVTLSGLTITGGTSASYPGIAFCVSSSAVDKTVNIVNCIITGNTNTASGNGSGIAAGASAGGFAMGTGQLFVTGSTVNNNLAGGSGSDIIVGTTKKSVFRDSTLGHVIAIGTSNPTCAVKFIDCRISRLFRAQYGTYSTPPVTVDLEGTVSFSNYINYGYTGDVRIVSGSTISLADWEPSTGWRSPLVSDILSVGVYTDAEENNWQVSGTATIICTAGTYSVSGSGTYFNPDGTTDLQATKLA